MFCDTELQKSDSSWNWAVIASTLGLRAGVMQPEDFRSIEKDASREALSIFRNKGEMLTSRTLTKM